MSHCNSNHCITRATPREPLPLFRPSVPVNTKKYLKKIESQRDGESAPACLRKNPPLNARIFCPKNGKRVSVVDVESSSNVSVCPDEHVGSSNNVRNRSDGHVESCSNLSVGPDGHVRSSSNVLGGPDGHVESSSKTRLRQKQDTKCSSNLSVCSDGHVPGSRNDCLTDTQGATSFNS